MQSSIDEDTARLFFVSGKHSVAEVTPNSRKKHEMRIAGFVLTGLAAVAIAPSFAQRPENLKRKFDDAGRLVAELPPVAFRSLLATLVRELHAGVHHSARGIHEKTCTTSFR